MKNHLLISTNIKSANIVPTILISLSSFGYIFKNGIPLIYNFIYFSLNIGVSSSVEAFHNLKSCFLNTQMYPSLDEDFVSDLFCFDQRFFLSHSYLSLPLFSFVSLVFVLFIELQNPGFDLSDVQFILCERMFVFFHISRKKNCVF